MVQKLSQATKKLWQTLGADIGRSLPAMGAAAAVGTALGQRPVEAGTLWLLAAILKVGTTPWENAANPKIKTLAQTLGKGALLVGCAAMTGLLLGQDKTLGTTTAIAAILWAIQACRRPANGLEGNPMGMILALLAIWVATSPNQGTQGESVATITTLAIILCLASSTTGQGTKKVVAITALMLALQTQGEHKNTAGAAHATATICLIACPGPLTKILALTSSTQPLKLKAASATTATAAAWALWLAACLWKITPAKPRELIKKGSLVACTLTVAALPLWWPAYLNIMGKNPSLTGRLPIWEHASRWIKYSPWEGQGPDFYQRMGTTMGYNQNLHGMREAHNGPIEYILRYGTPAGLLLIAAILAGALARGATPEEKLPRLAVLPMFLSDSIIPTPSPHNIYPAVASGTQTSPTAKSRTTPKAWAAAALWATGCWLLLPPASTLHHQLWVCPTNPNPEISHLDKSMPAIQLTRAIQKSKTPTRLAERLSNANTITVLTKTAHQADSLAAELEKNHIFTRTGKTRATEDMTRRNLVISLLPAAALLILWATGRSRGPWATRTLTISIMLLAAGTKTLSSHTQNPPEHTIQIPTPKSTSGSYTELFRKILEEQTLMDLIALEALPEKATIQNFQWRTPQTGNRAIRARKPSPWKNEIERAQETHAKINQELTEKIQRAAQARAEAQP
jgi:hypothetical protein